MRGGLVALALHPEPASIHTADTMVSRRGHQVAFARILCTEWSTARTQVIVMASFRQQQTLDLALKVP